jgi:hypothetical protein
MLEGPPVRSDGSKEGELSLCKETLDSESCGVGSKEVGAMVVCLLP